MPCRSRFETLRERRDIVECGYPRHKADRLVSLTAAERLSSASRGIRRGGHARCPGSAVVATEVKTLAPQTAAATDEIRAEIKGIQGSAQHVVAAITPASKTSSRPSGRLGRVAIGPDPRDAPRSSHGFNRDSVPDPTFPCVAARVCSTQ